MQPFALCSVLAQRCVWLAWLVGAIACGAPPGSAQSQSGGADQVAIDASAETAGEVTAADPFAGAPPALCRQVTPWPATGAFADVTLPTGVSGSTADPPGLGVAGIRLSTADLNGDFYPELSVRRHVAGARDTWETGKRLTWLLRNEAKSGTWTFADITQTSGLLQTRDGTPAGRTAHVVIFGDVDNDGDVDAFVGMNVSPDAKLDPNPQDSSELMLNQGDGTFALAAPSFAKGLRLTLNGASFTDYDRDGWLDLWLGFGTSAQGFPLPDRLLRGDGQGVFADVTKDEGLMTAAWTSNAAVLSGAAHRNTWGTAACDVDGNGHPDLLTTSYGRYFNGLWLGGQSGPRFVDAKDTSGFGRDDDDDWTTNLSAQCFCQEQPGAVDCGKVPKPKINCPAFKVALGGKYRWNHDTDRLPFRLGGNTGTVVCADIDRDGDLDLLTHTIVHADVGTSSDPTHVLRNDGNPEPKFVHENNADLGLERKWPDANWNAGDMTGATADFDNDGHLDWLVGSSDYPGTRAFLWRQLASGQFEQVPPAQGIDHKRAHGVAVADFDRDGDLDVVLGHSLARCGGTTDCQKTEQIRVLRNDLPPGNFVQVALDGGAGSNRSAIGARVRVKAGGVTWTQEVGGGYGHYGLQQDLVLHFGLGNACTIDEIEVRWPDAAATVEKWSHVRANYLTKLRQGDAKVVYPLVK